MARLNFLWENNLIKNRALWSKMRLQPWDIEDYNITSKDFYVFTNIINIT